MSVHESGEMYLEAIWVLTQKTGFVRSIDVSEYLGYSKPSVSVAMKNLRENGYISMDREGHITLEPSGLEIAETIYERHTMLTNFFVSLGVPREIAAEDACRMEHVISKESFEALKNYACEMEKKEK